MNKSEIMKVGYSVLSIYACISGINALIVPISMREQQQTIMTLTHQYSSSPNALSVVVFLPAGLLFLFSAFLWFSARRIELHSMVEAPSQDNESGLTAQGAQSIIFSALGIFLLVDSVSPLANMISFIASTHQNGISSRFWSQLASLAVRGLFTFGLGLWLILGSESLRRFKSWLLTINRKDW
jgi:hypothetical protein